MAFAESSKLSDLPEPDFLKGVFGEAAKLKRDVTAMRSASDANKKAW